MVVFCMNRLYCSKIMRRAFVQGGGSLFCAEKQEHDDEGA
jgi:hypothetical protein